MRLVDSRGRLFGRVNLVDAAVVLFLLVLLPVAYGTWLLFRPRKVQITSVTRVTLTKEEQRIANPLRAAAKLKVKGTGFSPMLRAWIGPEPSLGFTFEDPNSADVIAGPMPPGEYDVALYDGGQEVARAPKAYVIPARQRHDQIKVVGRILNLDRSGADRLQLGAVFPSAADARVRIAMLGPVEPGRFPLMVQPGSPQRERLDVGREGTFERSASVVLACDSGDETDSGCTIGGLYPAANAQLRLAGPADFMTLVVDEVLPAADPQPLDVTVRFSGGPELGLIAAGDRDLLLDDRAAVVTSVGNRSSPGTLDGHLRVGGDQAHDGWRYRNRPLKPGATLLLTTAKYIVTGTVVSVDERKVGR